MKPFELLKSLCQNLPSQFEFGSETTSVAEPDPPGSETNYLPVKIEIRNGLTRRIRIWIGNFHQGSGLLE